MATTAALIAGTGANVAGIGTTAWTNPGNITASDDTRATCAGAVVSNWLTATNFTMTTLPDDAAITRLIATVEGSYSGGTGVSITAATMIVAGAVAGNQLTLAQAFTTTDASYSFDLLPGTVGVAITAALLKTSTTGFAISTTGVGVTASRVDAMYLTVEYSQGFRIRVSSSTNSRRLRRPLISVR